MLDLNDLAYFVKVVDYQGFGPAARALNMQKSKLSRRVAALEDRLGARLIQRSTRHFTVTDIGHSYYQHCCAMLAEAEAAENVIGALRAEPAGLIRVACPPGLIAYRMGTAIAAFMAAHPKTEIQLKAFSRRVDVIREGFDIAIQLEAPQINSTELMMRKLGEVSQCLVAAPSLFEAQAPPVSPTELSNLPSISVGRNFVSGEPERIEWQLLHEDGSTVSIPIRPRFVSDDLAGLRAAALAGIGLAQMPNLMIEGDLTGGGLITVLPQWHSPNFSVFAVFASRRGLLPSVRGLIDHLAEDCNPYKHGTAPETSPIST
ncbi:MAG: LysR family transcriptional regulator [Rhodospirillaceae bacterium]|nr:LysR family transcriptional regulator [Rhodospirillaceae bacterium]